MRVLVGCESSGRVREAFRKRGVDAWSCDLLPADDGSPFHLQRDVREVMNDGWDLGIFFPDCTYLTNSAAWAYKDPDYVRYPGVGYHQKVKPGTLVGAARRQAREDAYAFVRCLYWSPIPKKAFENPVGVLSTLWRLPDQIIHPWMFGDDASKGTCPWLETLPPLVIDPKKFFPPRIVNGKKRWGNQTDSGQNNLSPSDDRWKTRSATYPGIAEAMAARWAENESLTPVDFDPNMF